MQIVVLLSACKTWTEAHVWSAYKKMCALSTLYTP